MTTEPEHTENLQEQEEILRRAVRRALKTLPLPALRALLRVVRCTEEGKSPLVTTAEDLETQYRAEAVFREAERLRGSKDRD